MKKLALTIVAAALALSTSAFAKSPDTQNTVTVQAKTLHRVVIAPDEFREIGGHYELEDGKAIDITQVQNRFYAEIPGLGKTEIIPTSNTRFVSKDNAVQIMFQTSANGYPTKLQASYAVAN